MTNINCELLLKKADQTGLSYSEISKRTEISRTTFYNISFGRTNPSIHAICNLADSLKMTQNDFLAIFFPNIKFEEEC